MKQVLLENMIALLIKEFGHQTVTKEVRHQALVAQVNYLTKMVTGAQTDISVKIVRIKMVRMLKDIGLRDAKFWVETYFQDDGVGPIVICRG